ELLTEVRFLIPPPTSGWAFAEFARRHGDFAIVGIAVLLDAEGERCTSARLATAGVGATPLRLREAEQILEQEGLTEQGIEAAAARAAELIDPQSDIHASGEFRHHLTRVLTRRALRQARARSQGRQV